MHWRVGTNDQATALSLAGSAEESDVCQVDQVNAIAADRAQEGPQAREVHLHPAIERHVDAERGKREIVGTIHVEVRGGIDPQPDSVGGVPEDGIEAGCHAVDVAEIIVSEDGDVHTHAPSVSRVAAWPPAGELPDSFREKSDDCARTPCGPCG